MKIRWNDSRCIICLEIRELSEEHIIPQSLGGILRSNFLCKLCNEQFGYGCDAKAKNDPAIRIAIGNLKNNLPKLYDSIENGQRYIVDVGSTKLMGVLRRNRIQGAEGKIDDGSIIRSEANTPKSLRTMLSRDGHDDDFIKQALEIYEDTSPGTKVALSPNIDIVKWNDRPAIPHLSGPEVSSLLLLKIAYEFTALLIDSAILADNWVLNRIRCALRSADENFATTLVERKIAPKYGCIHGICFQGNKPESTIEIRLFRRLAYHVRLPNVAIQMPRCVYTHNLKTNKDEFRLLNTGEDGDELSHQER